MSATGQDRTGQGQGHGKYESIHVRVAHTHAPQSATVQGGCWMTALSSVSFLIVIVIAAMTVGSMSYPLPTCRISWPACFSQVHKTTSVNGTSIMSKACLSASPRPSSKSQVTHANKTNGLDELVCGAATPVRACSSRSRYTPLPCQPESVTRPKQSIVRWAPATKGPYCTGPFLRVFTARPRSRTGQIPTPSSCIV